MNDRLHQIEALAKEIKSELNDSNLNYKKKSAIRWVLLEIEIQTRKCINSIND